MCRGSARRVTGFFADGSSAWCMCYRSIVGFHTIKSNQKANNESTVVLVPRFTEQTTFCPCLSLSFPSSASTNRRERAHKPCFFTLLLFAHLFLFLIFIVHHHPLLHSSLLATSLLLIPRIDGVPYRLCQVNPVQGHPGQGDPAFSLQHWREGRLIRFHHLGTAQGHKESTERLHTHSTEGKTHIPHHLQKQHGDLTI